jgi:hypothetical protein
MLAWLVAAAAAIQPCIRNNNRLLLLLLPAVEHGDAAVSEQYLHPARALSGSPYQHQAAEVACHMLLCNARIASNAALLSSYNHEFDPACPLAAVYSPPPPPSPSTHYQGLLPRASELLKLGASVFLAFVPFILAISLAFGGIYAVFGEHFVHGGDTSYSRPAYIDPETLLSEPTVDPYIPYR